MLLDVQKTIDDIKDYINGIWLKKRYIFICSWLICPVGFYYVASQPDYYSASARVYVDTSSMLQPLLRGLTIQTNPAQEVSMIAKTLKSRDNLEKIARESDLDIRATTPSAYESMISMLNDNLRLSSGGRDNIYSISFNHADPEMARNVVQETLDLFVEGSVGSSRQGTDAANRFLVEQITEYENRLASAEARLVEFKRKYADIIPVQGGFYGNLSGLKAELARIQLSIREAEKQIESLRANLAKQASSAADDFSVQSSSSNPLTTRYDSRIKNLEETLDQLNLRYTELHPDVVETQNLLNNLKNLRQEEINSYLGTIENSEELGNLSPLSSELHLEISRLESQIASLKVRETDYVEKIANLQSKIDLVPQIQAEETALNRDYGITKKKFEELLSRKESADLSQKADVSTEDVQFRVLVLPKLPTSPSGPERIIQYTIALFMGFAVGVGFAFLVSQLIPVLSSGSQLMQLTNYPVFGVVSHLEHEKMHKMHKVRLAIFFASCGLIISIYALLVFAEMSNINLYARIFS